MLGLKDLALARPVCTFFEAYWQEKFQGNVLPLRVGNDVATINDVMGVIEMLSSRREYTKASPFVVLLGKGNHGVTSSWTDSPSGNVYQTTLVISRSSITFVGQGIGETTILGGIGIHNAQNITFQQMTVTNTDNGYVAKVCREREAYGGTMLQRLFLPNAVWRVGRVASSVRKITMRCISTLLRHRLANMVSINSVTTPHATGTIRVPLNGAGQTSIEITSAVGVTIDTAVDLVIGQTEWTLGITAQGITESAGVTVTQGAATGTLKTALSNEWTMAITAQGITENAGVTVTQGASTAIDMEASIEVLKKSIGGLPEDIKAMLLANIKRRLTPQPIKIRADVDVSCYSYQGIDAVKNALREAKKFGSEEFPMTISLIAPPQYTIQTTSLEKKEGIARCNQAVEAVKKSILAAGGRLAVKMECSH